MTINNDAPYGSKSPWGSEVNKLAPYLYDTNFGRTIPDDYRSQTPAPIIPPGRINPAPVTPPPTLTIAQILGASASQITAWRGNSNYLPVLHRVLNTFSAANGAAISATQVTSLGAALAYLSPAGLRSLTYLAMQAVTSQVLMQPSANGAGDYVVDSLTQYQIQNLPNSTIASFTSSALSSTIAATGRSLLASLYYSQLGVISTGALGGLTLADLTQTSVLTPNGRSITVLQAMPWANIAQLSPAVVGALTASHLALTNLQAQATRAGTPVQTVLQGLTGSQVQKINTTTVQMLSNAQLTQTDAGGRLVWQDIIMNPAQASYLPSAFQWGNLTSTQVTSLFANLVKTVTVPNLGLGSFAAIPVASLVNGIIGLGANAGAFITALSNAQLAALTPNQVNGLITSSSGMAAILLNAGSPNSLSVSQFQALVTGNTTIAQINSTVLGKTLSVPALLSLTTPEITQFTGTQWQAILSNPALSRVIYNAGSGNGYWTAAQLQAVSATAIAQTTQNQYLQFTRGLSMFSQAQQNAMSTNVALLEIMITGQTGVWTQSQIAWIVENIPGVMSLSGLPGGGAGCFKGGNNENAGLRYQIQGGAYATMTSGVQIGAAISAAGWNSLSATNRAELLANPALQGVLRDLNRTQFIDVLSNANLMPQLNGNNLAALVPSIRRHILSMNNAERATLVQLNQNQISTLIGVRGTPIDAREDNPDAPRAENIGHPSDDKVGLRALELIAQYAPNALPGGRFSPENITALIAASRGVDALEHIARFAPNTLPVGGLSSENITALIAANGGAYALAHIAQYAPNTLPGGRLSSENITALIGANDGAYDLAQIAQYAPNTLTDIRLSPENITALIAANGGAYALAHIARYTPNTLPVGGLSSENITALIGANGGVDALAHIAQYAPNTLPGGRFSPENITALIAANGGVDALAQIARLTPAMLAGTALSQAQVNDLLSIATNITLTPRQRGRAIFALGSIAQYVRAMLADTVLSQAQVNNLLSIAVNTGFTADQRGLAVFALGSIAQYVPAMLAGRVLSQAQVNNLLSIVANITLTPDQRVNAALALGSIAQHVPGMLADIQITAGFFSGLNSSPELGVGFSNLVQMNLISGFDAGVLTSATLSNLSTVSALEGTVASLIANGRQDWINQALSTVTDLNLRANYQPDALLPSQLVGAAQTNTFDALYDAIRVAQGGNYTLSAAAFEAYAVTLQGGQYLNWLIVHHPDVVRATLTAAQNAQHAFVGGLSGPGLSATFLTQAGNNFWNEVATNHPDIVRFMGNNWANVFSNWSASAVRALGVHAVNQGGTGFIGLVSNNTNARALLGGAISRGVVINPEIFDAFATTAANFLGALTEMYIDVTSGSSLPFRALSLDGLVNLLRNGGVVLRDAEATQFSAISSNVLAALTSTQASLLPANFWQSITTTQLTAMFNSASLGVTFFGNANTPNHISQASLDAINPDVLAQSVAAVSTIREAIGGNWTLLTNAQQNSLVGANIPNFIPLQGHGGFAGNPLMINQQVVSGISLLAEQVTGVNSALMGSAQAALTEVQEVIKTGYQGEVATGATWAKGSTVTVSAAGFTDDQKAQLNSVLAQYANITGLTFQAVDSGGQINLGFANLGTATTGSVGLATITESNGQMQSAQILLENPAEDPIDVNGNYAGTQASFTQVLLHEIGHALGLADNNMAGSVENFYLGENNRTLSANDIAALQGLYDMPSGTSANANPVSLITVKALHQLVQAMAIANTPVGAITTSTGVFANNPVAGSSLTLAASTIH